MLMLVVGGWLHFEELESLYCNKTGLLQCFTTGFSRIA